MVLRSSAAIVLLLLAAPLATPSAGASEVTIAVFGDVGYSSASRANVARAVGDGASGYLGLGDYNYDASTRDWLAMMDPLMSRGAWLALGNHDAFSAFQPYMPGGSPQWTTSLGGVQVIAINTQRDLSVGSSQYNWLLQQLQQPVALKALVMHKGWWLGSAAEHPGSEFPGSRSAMDALVSKYDIDLVLAGHEHNYQRAERNGATYMIVGTGGRSIYPVEGSASGTVATCGCYGHLQLTLGPSGMAGRFVTTGGTVKDRFSIPADAAPPPEPEPAPGAFQATFMPKSVGNDWWIETAVSANDAIAQVEASRDGGSWSTLSKTSWGSWARSLHAPDGTKVQFRATSASGAQALSAVIAWGEGDAPPPPEPEPEPEPEPALEATFTPKSVGNDWWIEVKVASNEAIARVEASRDGGSWSTLSKTSWGSWARSLHAPDGTKVQFRATSASGAEALSAPVSWS